MIQVRSIVVDHENTLYEVEAIGRHQHIMNAAKQVMNSIRYEYLDKQIDTFCESIDEETFVLLRCIKDNEALPIKVGMYNVYPLTFDVIKHYGITETGKNAYTLNF